MIHNPPRVVVVVPTYNEFETLPILVDRLLELDVADLRVLVVDDNSPDGTGELAEKLALDRPDSIAVLHRPVKEGLGRAYVDGMSAALGQGADVVIQMDADLSHPPAVIPAMLHTLQTTPAAVVVGSRYVDGGGCTNWPLSRRLLSRWANFYVNAILHLQVRDATSGFKAWRRETLHAIDLPSIRSNGYSFQIEMNHRTVSRGLSIVETPITFGGRIGGESKMNLQVQAESALTPWRLRRDLWTGARPEAETDAAAATPVGR